ncbi:DEAD/DEAH box helicase family protein [Helicobacter didelphidarum]|nr:DEAD/DEAH box helicase family protein [Helicobacter didelphidarum]
MSKTLKLSDKIASALEYSDIEIPSHIRDNLSRNLREYQERALKHYLLHANKPNTNHLMFNMATGSGKTLIMAALMLDCYERGYRNFVFFVNSRNILEKTIANFSDKTSSKYLFNKRIIIDGKNVEIHIVQNFVERRENAINICFNTIQGIYSLFTNERENSLTFNDLREQQIVYLADEAHHLNSETKRGVSKSEEEHRESWEGIINEAFKKNDKNLMFEFSATIPNDSNVKEKYTDKIVFEYHLEKFYEDKYSKKIFLFKHENLELHNRFLGAILLNIYRESLAYKNGIFLKPVILFKSEKIAESKVNEEEFFSFIENLCVGDIEQFYNNIDKSKNDFLLMSLKHFEYNFAKILEMIKINFTKQNVMNVNDNEEAQNHQILLNNLEDKDNEIRAIFAVDKLNEGWDVLNLFDIVRCKSSGKSSLTITTKEAQLIGRGARYYPFCTKDSRENECKRKFDNNENNELRALEFMGYHTINEVEFIESLNKSLQNIGLGFENIALKKHILKPQKKIIESKIDKITISSNRRVKLSRLLDNEQYQQAIEKDIIKHISYLKIPLLGNNTIIQKEAFDMQNNEIQTTQSHKLHTSKEVFLKAMNKLDISFKKIAQIHYVDSRDKFIESFLYQLSCEFSKNQSFDRYAQLEIALFVLKHYKDKVKLKEESLYKVENFKLKEFYLHDREIVSVKDIKNCEKYEWLVYDKIFKDSNLEVDFLDEIDKIKDEIDTLFDKWFIVRNEQFSEFMIYDDREQIIESNMLKSNPNYAKGFAPDFVFIGFVNDKEVVEQIFIEAKGKHLIEYEKWKQDFLLSLKNKIIESKVNVNGMRFFTEERKKEFMSEFKEKLGHIS